MSSETVGIIFPPPDLRTIVDKTAAFVARNGPDFEDRIQRNEANNPKFNFLRPGDPYNAYYVSRVKEIRDNPSADKNAQVAASVAAGATGDQEVTSEDSQDSQDPDTIPKKAVSKKQQELSEAVAAARRGPPPDFEFFSDPPSISAQDLDVVKLTAQFVAIHGRSFITNLLQREGRNYQFDFLRPQHGLFSYFTQLIDQYTKILMPPKELLPELKKDSENRKHIMAKIAHRLEWTKISEAEKRREEEEAERERVQYAQIDWHDFVVVETVDYQANEVGLNFPPPTTPEQVGSRILLQQRIEQDQDDTEMDVESDEELEDASDAKKESTTMPPPLPPSLDNVIIRKDYNPKAKETPSPSTTTTAAVPTSAAAGKDSAWVISPITGEKIPANKLQEHMRYSLLDPKWVQEREQKVQDKMAQEDVFAPGVAIESSLRQFAERRSDIFGKGLEEEAIGRKIGEREDKKADRPTWDGHKASAESVMRDAKHKITIEDKISHKNKLKEDELAKEKIGPAVVPSRSSKSSEPLIGTRPQQNPPQPHFYADPVRNTGSGSSSKPMKDINPAPLANPSLLPQVPMAGGGSSSGLLPSPVPPLPTNPYLARPHAGHLLGNTGGLYGAPPPSGGVPPLGMPAGLPQMPIPISMPPYVPTAVIPPPVGIGGDYDGLSGEPLAKKLRQKEEDLIPEQEFMAAHPDPVSFSIQVPDLSDRTDVTLRGQTLSVTLGPEETITAVKNVIHNETGLVPGKQKLQIDKIYPRDSNSLAFYNVTPGSVMILSLKERGGRKK